MKNIVKYVLGISLIFTTAFLNAQVMSDFELGNRGAYRAQCWQFYSTDVRTDAALSGSYGVRTGSLSNMTNPHTLITPWIEFSGTGQITFSHKLQSYNANYPKYLDIRIMDEDSAFTFLKQEFLYPNGQLITESIDINFNGIYQIFFEWYGSGGNIRAYFDDLSVDGIFMSDISSNNGVGVCAIMGAVVDTDGDGISDEDEDYPDDPYRAYNNYSFGGEWASLAFEDLWPAYGDFDFNDLVIDFKSNFVTNADDQLVEMLNEFKVRAIGASFKNGFGFRMEGIPNNAVLEVNGAVHTESIINLEANGVESGQSSATLIAFDNAFDLLPHPGQGSTGVNTSSSSPFVEPQSLNFNVIFMVEGVAGEGGPIDFSDYMSDEKAVNPFIFVNGERGKEIHLADYPPTDLVDNTYFGTLQDDSNPGADRYYKSEKNFPWAILLPETFNYPIEKSDINEAHLKFSEWAESNGLNYQDWFQNKIGYRDESKIY